MPSHIDTGFLVEIVYRDLAGNIDIKYGHEFDMKAKLSSVSKFILDTQKAFAQYSTRHASETTVQYNLLFLSKEA